MSHDASATYRGFRCQALYALHRLLTDASASEQTYRPEGSEDLAIFDSQMRLIEAIQIKNYSANLSLSALKPDSNAGFFARLKRRRDEHEHCATKLASFGPLGPELSGAIRNADIKDAKHREEIVKKVCESNTNITRTDIASMLDGLQGNVVYPVEANLVSEVMHSLQDTNVAGELNRSIELLMYWVFDASEHRHDLTKQGLLRQLERIGSYLAALRDSSAAWDVSVCAIKTLELSEEEAARFIEEYRRGIQARWEHIVSGADCARPDRINEIHRQFQHHPVVILRGASGQGKSTLGWRYLHDYSADGIRFHVKLVEGREHAIQVANALGGHVRRLNLIAVAYLDVSPADTGWSELVKELVAAGLKVLIAVREEDFRRANISIGDFDYSEVVLDRVTKEEAEPIFSALHRDHTMGDIDFEEAWARFAMEEGGPLLEFTHLVSEGESLDSRIASQIRQIRNYADNHINGMSEVHLELLALSAVANETGARVSLARLCDAVGANPLTAPLRALDSEYLFRIQDAHEGSSVGGLHALRSKAVVNALFSEMPELWEMYAIRALPLVVDEDVESFLLSVFSRKPEYSETIFEQLKILAPRSWTHAASIAAGLIWEGVSRYEVKNREAILGAMAQYGAAWWLVCDSFVGTDGNIHRETLETMNDVLKASIETIQLTPKAEVFEFFATWALNAPAPPTPKLARDWSSAGDVAYWLGHIGIDGALRAGIKSLLTGPLPAELSIDELSRYVSGLAHVGGSDFTAWHETERQVITQRFLCETDSVHLVDDGHEVKVYYSVPLADSVTEGMRDGHDWHEQTMKRVRLLRLLFPNREIIGAQGLGLEMIVEQLGHDPTFKSIPSKSLPMEQSVRLNAIFSSVVAYRHSRPRTWKEYADSALAFRKAASNCFHKLQRGWAKLLSEAQPKKSTIRQLPTAELDQLTKLSKLPMFPRGSVDEWGFLSEETKGNQTVFETMQQRSLRRFNPWRKAYSDYESGVNMVASKVFHLTKLCLAEHKGHLANEEDNKAGHLLLVNLGNAWGVLSEMQREFRARFGHFYSSEILNELDAHEHSNFQHLWAVSIAMRYDRQSHVLNIGRKVETGLKRRRLLFLESLKDEVNSALGEYGTATVRETSWILNDVPHLCIVCDFNHIDATELCSPLVVEAVWRAAQAGGWRPLEWKPLEVEWPKIALVNLVCGKSLLPACASISTVVFLATSEVFQVKPHHLLQLPVSPEEFEACGFKVWLSPLIRTILLLQGNVGAFVMTNMRYYQLASLILEHGLDQSNTERILASFSREIQIVLTVAQQSYAQSIHILDTSAAEKKAHWKQQLQHLCGILLFDVEENSSVSINVDTFVDWTKDLESTNNKLQELFFEILSFALEEEHTVLSR